MDRYNRRCRSVLDRDGVAVDVEGAEARRLLGRVFRVFRLHGLRGF